MAAGRTAVNIGPAADTPFDDEQGFLSFLGDNEIAHIAFASRLAQLGVVITNIIPVGSPYDDTNWMFDHWARHQEECSHLGIAVPDLSVVDLNNEAQYLDWMELHGQLHELQNTALGIRT